MSFQTQVAPLHNLEQFAPDEALFVSSFLKQLAEAMDREVHIEPDGNSTFVEDFWKIATSRLQYSLNMQWALTPPVMAYITLKAETQYPQCQQLCYHMHPNTYGDVRRFGRDLLSIETQVDVLKTGLQARYLNRHPIYVNREIPEGHALVAPIQALDTTTPNNIPTKHCDFHVSRLKSQKTTPAVERLSFSNLLPQVILERATPILMSFMVRDRQDYMETSHLLGALHNFCKEWYPRAALSPEGSAWG